MRSILVSGLVFFAGFGCSSQWTTQDADGDGVTVADGDCWDNPEGPDGRAGADIHPGAAETWYDGLDQDCSGSSDFDQDGDGHAAVAFAELAAADAIPLPADDCWDDPAAIPADQTALDPGAQPTAADVHPGAIDDWYDGADADCAGGDDFDQDGDGHASATHAGPDGAGEDCFDAADDAFTNEGALDPADVYPAADDAWYDGTDADCAGDDDFDQDLDGFPRDEECDDTDPARYPDPAVPEVWYDGLDANCDGNDGDQDGDGFYAADYAYEIPPAYTAGDCWDDPAEGSSWSPLAGFDPFAAEDVYPGAAETWYDGLDQDCAGDGDFDQDADSYASNAWPDTTGVYGDDCDDVRAETYPGAADAWYDGVDADCFGNDDYDQDGDTYASLADVPSGDDCDDRDAAVNPSALELCGNEVDEDCSTSTNDEDAVGCAVFYVDADADAYGTDADNQCLCEASGAYVALVAGDCDDGAAATHPGADETCATEADDDCDGVANGNDALECVAYFADADGDTFGVGSARCQCDPDATYSADNADDCDDDVSGVFPGAAETCNDIDDNCDGDADEGLPLSHVDADGDSFGDETDPGDCSTVGGVTNAEDCNDDSVYAYPGAAELCDGGPNNCDTDDLWTEAEEDERVAFVSTAGVWSDVSSTFDDAIAPFLVIAASGTYNFCAGSYAARVYSVGYTLDFVGIYGADRTTLVNNYSVGSVMTLSDGRVRVSGLTLSGGTGNGTSPNLRGGAVFASGTIAAPSVPTVVLEDCVVSGNTANYGGGIYSNTFAWVELDNTVVSGNTATNGAGMYVYATAKATLLDAEITGNTGVTGGGILSVATTGSVALSGTLVHANTASVQGGGVFQNGSTVTTLTLTDSSIYANSAPEGGGLYLLAGLASCSATTTGGVTSGGIYANTATTRGGGVYMADHNSSTARFSSTGCDYGTGATDNAPHDISIKTSGSAYATEVGSTGTFTCMNATDDCR